VIGVSFHEHSIKTAKKIKAIDSGSVDIKIIRDADLVILAAPVAAILRLAPLIARIIKKDCIVTDVGSTKVEIVFQLEKLFPNYIGSHPLAGSEKRSVSNACPELFQDSLCLLTPTKRTKPFVVRIVKDFWTKLGAKVSFISPAFHDKVLSFVSHLPHVSAFSLISIIPGQYLKFAAGGLRDTTRIAASDSELWADIFLSNPENVIKAIDLYKARLCAIQSAIKERDRKRLKGILNQAQKKRDMLI
ncbi:MAG: prephenate dehydrogenase, partial [Candidatus Omnitrophota bacterium]